VPDSTDLASLIRDLAGADPARRAGAAAEIFRRGRGLAHSATRKWLDDAELAACLTRGRDGLAEFTVGVAVEPETFERIRGASGLPRLADVPPDQDAKEFELDFPNGTRLDVLTTRQPGGSGAIARYLQKFGGGIQQVEIAATDVDRATEILRARFGIEPVYPATRAGADGTRVNFFLVPPPNGKKILIELVERRVNS